MDLLVRTVASVRSRFQSERADRMPMCGRKNRSRPVFAKSRPLYANPSGVGDGDRISDTGVGVTPDHNTPYSVKHQDTARRVVNCRNAGKMMNRRRYATWNKAALDKLLKM